MTRNTAGKEPFLPDLCRATAVFFLVLVGELLALVLALAASGPGRFDWMTFGLVSLYVQWIGLMNAAALCLFRRWLVGYVDSVVAAASVAVVIVTTATVSVTARSLAPGLEPFDPAASVTDVVITVIFAGIALRYFYLQHELRLQQQAEMQSRLEALQARIRPHFLFNSINTIAGMIPQDPVSAEDMLEDLASLFRGALATERVVSLAEDIELARSYLHIEQRRLGPRLVVDWQLDSAVEAVRVPVLMLQPLLENAVYHGIQPLAGGGTVTVRSWREGNDVRLDITNPLPDGAAATAGAGHGMALENTRRRLELLHPGRAGLSVDTGGGRYRTSIRLPAA